MPWSLLAGYQGEVGFINENVCHWSVMRERAIVETLCNFLFQVDALMSLLTKLRTEDPSVKSLVISQFTSMLNILETPLKAQGFNFVRLDGKMSQKQRAEVIEWFNEKSPDSPTVMLLSMKAGGVGLNLTAASRVFLLDPVCRYTIVIFFYKRGGGYSIFFSFDRSQIKLRGSFSNDDVDGNENVKTAISLLSKTTSLHVHHFFFCTFLWRNCTTTT